MGAVVMGEVAKVLAPVVAGVERAAAEMAAAVRAVVVRAVVVREEAVREAAARAADHWAVAVGLGDLQKAHWEGRKAPAARVVEATGGATLGRSN